MSQKRIITNWALYNPSKNPYLTLGFLWGLPIPYFLFLVHCNAANLEFNFLTLKQVLVDYPLYTIFLFHPIFFALSFGIFGALKISSDEALESHLKTYQSLACKDHLTGLLSRNYFYHRAHKELIRSQREKSQLCLLFFDLDHFKRINDCFGHITGDHTLVKISQLIKKDCRPYDLVARWGGEEFIVLLPNIALSEAYLFAERVRKQIYDLSLKAPSMTFHCTTSCGIAQLKPDENLTSLINRADQAVYEAKEKGRNQSCLHPTENYKVA